MMHQNDSSVVIEVDDEHPFFTTVWEQSKAARKPVLLPDGSGVPPSPEALSVELRLGDTAQKFYLESVSDLKWHDARAYMTTRWRPTGEPTTTKGDVKA